MHDPVLSATILIASVALVALPALAHRADASRTVATSKKGATERLLLALAAVGFALPLLWAFTPLLGFADYPPSTPRYLAGVACYLAGLAILYWSHRSLGESWSISLELRERHSLVTRGAYAHVRHPMYFALLLYGLGQALVVPNWIAGPAYLAVAILLFGLRVRPEEQMMRETFGDRYETYRSKTARLLPGLW